jgi:hypothetical protein
MHLDGIDAMTGVYNATVQEEVMLTPVASQRKTHYPVLYSTKEPMNLLWKLSYSSYEMVPMHFRQLTKINFGEYLRRGSHQLG